MKRTPSEGLSVIHINIDSLNRHYLAPYGFEGTSTPTLSDFAERAITFENHRVGSLACVPARREMWSGHVDFLHRPWGPVEPFDRPVARHLDRSGASRSEPPGPSDGVAAMITDHYHYFEWGAHNYYEDFHGYEFIRGHEIDPYRTAPLPPFEALPGWAQRLVEQGPFFARYVRNALALTREDDFFAPRVMRAAAEWIDRNHAHERFYLVVDCFDVHEPFHVPEPYASMYTDLSTADHTCWPHYGRMGEGALTDFNEEDLEFLRAQYRGKVTMTDRHLARVFEAIDRHDLWERVAVIVGTDHGHYLGERGWIGKPACSVYDAVGRIPLFIFHPEIGGGRRVEALTQTVDLYPTVLELLGYEPHPPFRGRSLVPYLREDEVVWRDGVIYGYFGRQMNAANEAWTYHRQPRNGNQPLHFYSAYPMNPNNWFGPVEGSAEAVGGRFIPYTDIPVWKTPCTVDYEEEEDMLFHIESDPEQQHNVADEHPDVVDHMQGLVRKKMKEADAPEEQYERLAL